MIGAGTPWRERPAMPQSRPLAEHLRGRLQPVRLADGYQTSMLFYAGCGPRRREPVVYIHGIQSHPGWFVGSCAALAAAGHDVYAITRRGSGDNTLDRGHASSARQLLDDLDAACRLAAERSSAAAVHLVGVSWGGKLAAVYAARGGGVKLASLCMVAPGVATRVDLPAGRKLLVAAALLAGGRRQFDIPLSDVELFTDNPAMRQYLLADGLRLQRATARFLFASRQLDSLLARSVPLAVPATLVLASRDRIIDNGHAERLVAPLAGGGLSVVRLEGCHTLEFEPDPSPLYDALCAATGEGVPASRRS